MDRIILFDIDKTIFDRDNFLGSFDDLLQEEFKLSNNELEDIVSIYDGIKNDFGYFSPQAYLERIYKIVPSLNKKLDYYFGQENINKYLFQDSEVLFSLKDIRVGIFSKGDIGFQKMKIAKFLDILEEDLIYVFHDKLKKLPQVLNSNRDSKLYLVDDKIDVLVAAKDIDENIKTIHIDHEGKLQKPNGVDFKLKNLSDIISILHE